MPVRQAVQDYQLRTFTSHDAPEPRAPPGVTVLCCHRLAALGRAGMVEFVPLPHREMQWAPVPIRSDTIAYSHGALALPRLRYGGPPRCTPNPCARRRGVQPLRWRIAFGFLTELRPCPPGAAPPGAPVRLHPPMLLKPLLMMRPPPPRQVPVGLLAAFWLTRGPPLGARRGSGQHQLLALRSSTARRSRGSCAYRARSLASRPQGNRLVGAGSPTPRGLCACRPADPRCCSRPHCRNRPCSRRAPICRISLRASTRRGMPAGRCGSCVSRMVTFLRRCRKFSSNVSVAMPSAAALAEPLSAAPPVEELAPPQLPGQAPTGCCRRACRSTCSWYYRAARPRRRCARLAPTEEDPLGDEDTLL